MNIVSTVFFQNPCSQQALIRAFFFCASRRDGDRQGSEGGGGVYGAGGLDRQQGKLLQEMLCRCVLGGGSRQ